jgi:hypothetical protein
LVELTADVWVELRAVKMVDSSAAMRAELSENQWADKTEQLRVVPKEHQLAGYWGRKMVAYWGALTAASMVA